MFTSTIAHSFSGIQQNYALFNDAVQKISNPDSPAGINEIVQMKQAEQGIKVNAAVIQTANEMSDHLVDLLA